MEVSMLFQFDQKTWAAPGLCGSELCWGIDCHLKLSLGDPETLTAPARQTQDTIIARITWLSHKVTQAQFVLPPAVVVHVHCRHVMDVHVTSSCCQKKVLCQSRSIAITASQDDDDDKMFCKDVDLCKTCIHVKCCWQSPPRMGWTVYNGACCKLVTCAASWVAGFFVRHRQIITCSARQRYFYIRGC